MTGAMAAAVAAGIVAIDIPTLLGLSSKLWALFLGAYGVGCNALVAFLSQSFGDWKAQRTVDAGGTAPQFTKTPQAETKG